MDSVILQDRGSTHYDNGDGTATVVISDNLNYLSRGEWREVDTYYLEYIGDDAWSNYADDYPVTLVGGVVSTPDGWWQVDGVYLGETKLWEPDFTNYGKIGDTVSYLTPWGVLRYTIRPDSYREEFVFNENPVAGLLVDGDALTVRYIGGIDSVVWSKDALGREYPVASTTTEKSISREDLYRAEYPLVLDPSGAPISSNGDVSASSTSVYTLKGDYLFAGTSYEDKGSYSGYYVSIVGFDLSALAGVTVTGATLGLYSLGHIDGGGNRRVIGSSGTTNPGEMSASEVTYYAQTGTYLGTVQNTSVGWGTPLSGSSVISFVTIRLGTIANFGLTGNIIGDGGDGYGLFASRSNPTSAYRPYLTVTYTTGTTYTLTYDANGGVNPPSAQTGGTTYTVSGIGSMTRAGYNFVAWNTAANGSGTSYAPSASITLSADTTLYAQWQAATTSYRPYFYRLLYGG